MAVDVSAIDVNKALVRRAIGYNHGAADSGTDIFAPTSWPTCRQALPDRAVRTLRRWCRKACQAIATIRSDCVGVWSSTASPGAACTQCHGGRSRTGPIDELGHQMCSG
jgi:hypothetical protein